MGYANGCTLYELMSEYSKYPSGHKKNSEERFVLTFDHLKIQSMAQNQNSRQFSSYEYYDSNSTSMFTSKGEKRKNFDDWIVERAREENKENMGELNQFRR